jgi:predicted GIY-YIG superfamily endonuclease
MTGYVYMTASQKAGTIYIGVTNDLGRRMPEHKSGEGSRFTSRYGVQRLVWYEEFFDITDAIQREKSLKRWPRQWKDRIDRKDQSGMVRAVSRDGVVGVRFLAPPEHCTTVTAWILGSPQRRFAPAPP